MLDTEGVKVLTGLIDIHPGFPGFAENTSSKKTAKNTKKFRGDLEFIGRFFKYLL